VVRNAPPRKSLRNELHLYQPARSLLLPSFAESVVGMTCCARLLQARSPPTGARLLRRYALPPATGAPASICYDNATPGSSQASNLRGRNCSAEPA